MGGFSQLMGPFNNPLMQHLGAKTPQAGGYGISPPQQPGPYNTGPGLMPGQPTGMMGANFNLPGAGEKFFSDNAHAYGTPGAQEQQWAQKQAEMGRLGQGERWWANNKDDYQQPLASQQVYEGQQGQLQGPGMGEKFAQGQVKKYAGGTPQVSQNSENFYQQHMANRPNVSAEPGLGAYYDNAKRRREARTARPRRSTRTAKRTPTLKRSEPTARRTTTCSAWVNSARGRGSAAAWPGRLTRTRCSAPRTINLGCRPWATWRGRGSSWDCSARTRSVTSLGSSTVSA